MSPDTLTEHQARWAAVQRNADKLRAIASLLSQARDQWKAIPPNDQVLFDAMFFRQQGLSRSMFNASLSEDRVDTLLHLSPDVADSEQALTKVNASRTASELEALFLALTGQSMLRASARICRIAVRNLQREAGTLGGAAE
ncbi:MAG: hypothetical protein ACK51V_01975, partial [bacterium]